MREGGRLLSTTAADGRRPDTSDIRIVAARAATAVAIRFT
ncbi:hypothetical protein MYA_4739 [Burkholderia sp. KJ006]|nr:hypothetical protein MYA_4739 [Burkholderia sp. KJ006]